MAKRQGALSTKLSGEQPVEVTQEDIDRLGQSSS